ncbi:MAG TPA: glycosyltransferase family 4 protein [Candidatus Acidoferrales bacterium]|jgi:glycosyltransferase involved in cell wall biosynthesis|nr:glycosyltransferase family 4 protein [Candidatus Acidoferrales bacterium]
MTVSGSSEGRSRTASQLEELTFGEKARAFRILARSLSGPALPGDSHLFVLKRRNTTGEAKAMETQRGVDGRGGVIVAHPGTQHSYQTALAMQRAGLLHSYLTGFYFKPASPMAWAMRILPDGMRATLGRELRRRYSPELDPGEIRTRPALELLCVATSRLGLVRRFSDGLMRLRNERFDVWVARVLDRERPGAVVCYDSCGLRAFQQARSLGVICVLDQSIGHIKSGLRLFREEAELHPEFAETLPLAVPDWFVERCCKELELADHILVSSCYVKQTLFENGVRQDKIKHVPYGAEIDSYTRSESKGNGSFRLLFVGQLSQRKGIKYLLEAFRNLRLPGSELVLVGGIVGSGKGLQPYREIFRHVPIVPRGEVHHYFRQADLFVYPSLHEGSALSIYEALASGLPVIATPNCGSVVRNGIEGFIVPIRDVEALKERILLLYENRELREEMGRRARLRAEEFTWATYRQRLSQVMLDLLASRG